MVVHACYLSYMGSMYRRIVVQVSLGITSEIKDTDDTGIKRTMEEHYKLYAHIFDNLDETGQLFERYILPKLTQG
jgi:hypothetical protein